MVLMLDSTQGYRRT